MDLHDLKKQIQNHMSDGLVTIVGSGLSCAESLPGMAELSDHLIASIKLAEGSDDFQLWAQISALIIEKGLENALLQVAPSQSLETLISVCTSSFIASRERDVITSVFNGTRTLRLTRLLPHMLKPNLGIPIITTNYDRLVEIAVEEAGLGVDTMFVGQFAGQLKQRESQLSFCSNVTLRKKQPYFTYRNRANVFKPHGSLDWYLRKGRPVRYSGELPDATRLIITPGNNKFRNGYESPFDLHRERANKAIDSASSFLVLGYGFNDNHLETHLTPRIKEGRPTLLLTHTLSDIAHTLAVNFPNVLALDHLRVDGQSGTRVIYSKQTHFFPSVNLWDLENLVREVFEP